MFLIGFKAALSSLSTEQRNKLPGIKLLVDTNFPKKRSLCHSNSVSIAAMLLALH
jgi:hypothetical protein